MGRRNFNWRVSVRVFSFFPGRTPWKALSRLGSETKEGLGKKTGALKENLGSANSFLIGGSRQTTQRRGPPSLPVPDQEVGRNVGRPGGWGLTNSQGRGLKEDGLWKNWEKHGFMPVPRKYQQEPETSKTRVERNTSLKKWKTENCKRKKRNKMVGQATGENAPRGKF